jgi:hypothetical protein
LVRALVEGIGIEEPNADERRKKSGKGMHGEGTAVQSTYSANDSLGDEQIREFFTACTALPKRE